MHGCEALWRGVPGHALVRFRPAGEGVITATNASQVSDGAAAVLVAERVTAVADGRRCSRAWKRPAANSACR